MSFRLTKGLFGQLTFPEKGVVPIAFLVTKAINLFHAYTPIVRTHDDNAAAKTPCPRDGMARMQHTGDFASEKSVLLVAADNRLRRA